MIEVIITDEELKDVYNIHDYIYEKLVAAGIPIENFLFHIFNNDKNIMGNLTKDIRRDRVIYKWEIPQVKIETKHVD